MNIPKVEKKLKMVAKGKPKQLVKKLITHGPGSVRDCSHLTRHIRNRRKQIPSSTTNGLTKIIQHLLGSKDTEMKSFPTKINSKCRHSR